MDRNTDWHRSSWLRCLTEGLPQLLSEHCTVSTYTVNMVAHSPRASIELGILSEDGELRVRYDSIELPDDAGVFTVEGTRLVVVPTAENETLDDIRCAGDQLLEFLGNRVAAVSGSWFTSPGAVRDLLPIDHWVSQFLQESGQILDARNWISQETHVRRIRLTNPSDLFAENQFLCPFETPTGPNIGRVLTVAAGVRIAGGRLVASDRPLEIGPAASYIPFLDRDDPARLIMGSNMMRQWIEPETRETALVQSGTEPDAAEFWCGFNLLTAFASYTRVTMEDGILLSESAARRLQYPGGIHIGDKLSNRHGQKGVVADILPDTAMPTLDDGTAVECVVSFIGLHTRQNTGQLWEAAFSWLAKHDNAPRIVPPYNAPSRSDVATELEALGNPHRSHLSLPSGGSTDEPVLAGWVYWGCTVHRAEEKLKAAGADSPLQLHGEMEYNAFRRNGLECYIAESNGFASAENDAAGEELVTILENGLAGSKADPAPLVRLREQLKHVGIEVKVDTEGVGFQWAETADAEELPSPVRHPWMSWKVLYSLPPNPGSASRQEVSKKAERVRLLMASHAPDSLVENAKAGLQQSVDAYFAGILPHEDVVPRGRRRFTGRGVISPLRAGGIDRIGLPEEMAWTLFGPLLRHRLEDREIESRSRSARTALEEEMDNRWVIANRAPTISDTTMIAFRPVLVPHGAVELHPLVCRWMNADFDGDMVGIYLPVSPEAQAEVRERISVAGHLRRNPQLIESLLPTNEALWGLDAVTDIAAVFSEIRTALAHNGPEAAIAKLEAAFDAGVAAAAESGASLDPTVDVWSGGLPPSRAEAEELLSAGATKNNGLRSSLPAQVAAVTSTARGSMQQLLDLVHSKEVAGTVIDGGRLYGHDVSTHRRLALEVRRHFHTLVTSLPSVAGDYSAFPARRRYSLLARLLRAEVPGVVVASAAESGERDPIHDADAKVIVGRIAAESSRHATSNRSD